jgi:hypothetical protein
MISASVRAMARHPAAVRAAPETHLSRRYYLVIKTTFGVLSTKTGRVTPETERDRDGEHQSDQVPVFLRGQV